MTQPGPAPSNAGRADVAGAAKRPPGPEAGGGSCGYVRGAGDAVAGRWDAACGAGRRGQAPGPGRGGGTAPTFPASGPGVRGAEPPERCLPPSSSPRPRPAARHTILAGSGSRAERLVSVGAGVSAGRRGQVERSSREKEEARGQSPVQKQVSTEAAASYVADLRGSAGTSLPTRRAVKTLFTCPAGVQDLVLPFCRSPCRARSGGYKAKGPVTHFVPV
ncbi:translation initiation factor IF-2-like [Canis lupus dingo]|uniref:translation initiation factor IF-2-like n=1 Tax=Canis lupus dingo TaxID=286419 RepID=UPI0006B3C409|nr:translation initiation factor IF-2-like [Canis lupus dingo]|eukprot:XP_013973709.1 uncharacterized protein LOC102154829 [Canis lupus familiaris]